MNETKHEIILDEGSVESIAYMLEEYRRLSIERLTHEKDLELINGYLRNSREFYSKSNPYNKNESLGSSSKLTWIDTICFYNSEELANINEIFDEVFNKPIRLQIKKEFVWIGNTIVDKKILYTK